MIKARRIRAYLLAFLLILFVSCSSLGSGNSYEVITEEEAAQALKTAIITAATNADTEFYRQLSNNSFLPENYTFITELKSIIPGLSQMMDNWKAYVEDFIYSHLEDFYSFVETRASNMEVTDPLTYVETSNTSMTEAFSALYSEEITAFWASCLEGLEELHAYNILNQYTNWVVSQSLIYGIETPGLEYVDIKEYLSKHLTNLYLDLLAREEELFRTTPDPYGDKIARKVFKTY